MFDSLLGSKFSNKCKQSVKGIKCRMETIRKKRHATARYLEKVIADLISSGQDADAFGRMDALLSEINLVWCYDMIDNYCCYIVKHLPTMQKERVCTEETREAVATLIFAAARFSDLPELVDLRHWFTSRYGSNMETYTNTEFVDKAQKKSFSQDKKLQLMQDITQEHRVNWDVKLFEYTVSNSTLSFDQSRMHVSSSNEIDKQFHASDGRREAVRGNEIVNGRRTVQNSGRAVHQQQELPKEHKNFHTTHNNTNTHPYDSSGRIGKVATNESENIEPHHLIKGSAVNERQGKNDKAAIRIPPHSTFAGDLNETSSSQYIFGHSMNEMEQNGKEKQHKASNLKPPYVKPTASKTPSGTGYVKPRKHELYCGREDEEDLKAPENIYKASNLNPPYAKPMANRTPLPAGYVKPRSHEVYSGGEYEDDLKNAPFSSRIKNLEKSVTASSDSSSEDGMHVDVNSQQSFITSQSERREDDPICGAVRHGRHMYRTFSDQPRRGMYNGEGGNELQTHPIVDPDADSFSEDGDKSCFSSQANRKEDDSICGVIYHGRHMYRAFSDHAQEQTITEEVNSGFSANYMSRTSLSPTEAPVRKQVRSLSMQPDRPRLNGRSLHRELPDYDDLAARIAALRNS